MRDAFVFRSSLVSIPPPSTMILIIFSIRLNAYFDFDVSIDNGIAIDGARCMFPDKVMQ